MILKLIKSILSLISFILLIPFFILYLLHIFSFMSISQLLSLVPGYYGIILRRVWYKLTLEKCGDNFSVDFLAAIRTPKTRIGNNVYLGVEGWVGLVDIGDDVMFADHVRVLSGSKHHGISKLDVPMRLQEGEVRRVKIGNDCWIGSGAIIMEDLADHSVVGAGSVVTKKFAPYDIIAGVPAQKIKSRKGDKK